MSRRRVLATLRVAVVVLVIGFLSYQVWQLRHDLAESLRAIEWQTMLLATLVITIGGIPGFYGWRVLLSGLGTNLSLPNAAWVFYLANTTKYLPGSVWPTVAHAALARSLGEPPLRFAAASLGGQGLTAVTGLVVGLLALPPLVHADPRWWLLLPVIGAALLLLVFPSTLGRLLGIARRVLRRDAAPVPFPGRRPLLMAASLKTASWLIGGLHLSLLALAFGVDPVAAVTLGVGGFALSMVAGIASLVAPSGLGVRELVLWLAFTSVLTYSDLVTLMVLSRVLLTLSDAAITAAVLGTVAVLRRPGLRARANPTEVSI